MKPRPYVHRAWTNIKLSFATADDLAVLEECERGEDAARSAYELALKKTCRRTSGWWSSVSIRALKKITIASASFATQRALLKYRIQRRGSTRVIKAPHSGSFATGGENAGRPHKAPPDCAPCLQTNVKTISPPVFLKAKRRFQEREGTSSRLGHCSNRKCPLTNKDKKCV